MLATIDDTLVWERFGRCVQICQLDYQHKLAATLTRYCAEIARIIADRPLEFDEARQLAVRFGLLEG